MQTATATTRLPRIKFDARPWTTVGELVAKAHNGYTMWKVVKIVDGVATARAVRGS